MELLGKCSDKDVYIFKNRNEADEFLNQIYNKNHEIIEGNEYGLCIL